MFLLILQTLQTKKEQRCLRLGELRLGRITKDALKTISRLTARLDFQPFCRLRSSPHTRCRWEEDATGLPKRQEFEVEPMANGKYQRSGNVFLESASPKLTWVKQDVFSSYYIN